MITFIAYFTVVPENAAAVEELLDHVATMSNTEPGVVHYGVAQSVEDASTYSIVEVYRDQEAVAAHGQTAWVTESVPKFLGLIDGLPDIRQYVSPGTAPVAAQFDGLS
jgi:quinol monooxygenase YgiN